MTAANRRAELIRILRGRKKDIIENLALELGVSERTIRRDLITLTVDEGYHIDTVPGIGGGVVLHGYSNPYKGILSQEQIKVLTELTQQVDGGKARVLREILETYG